MRKLMLTTTALLGLAVMPALANEMTSTTQSPPSVNANEANVQSDNSLPPSADTSTYDRAGSHLGEEEARSPAVVQRGPAPDTGASSRLFR